MSYSSYCRDPDFKHTVSEFYYKSNSGQKYAWCKSLQWSITAPERENLAALYGFGTLFNQFFTDINTSLIRKFVKIHEKY